MVYLWHVSLQIKVEKNENVQKGQYCEGKLSNQSSRACQPIRFFLQFGHLRFNNERGKLIGLHSQLLQFL